MSIEILLVFILSTLSALVGAGGASVMLVLIIYFFGFEIVEGYATNCIPELLLALIPGVIYFFYGFVNIPFALMLFVGGMIGGFIGSKTALKKGSKWVRSLFIIIVIISTLKILFNL